MKHVNTPSRAELLDALETLKTEQRRIDNAISAIEIFLRADSWPENLEGIARYQPPRAANGGSLARAPKMSARAGATPDAIPRKPGIVVQFPLRSALAAAERK